MWSPEDWATYSLIAQTLVMQTGLSVFTSFQRSWSLTPLLWGQRLRAYFCELQIKLFFVDLNFKKYFQNKNNF